MIKCTYFWGRADGVDPATAEEWYAQFLLTEGALPGLRGLASWRVREAPQPADVKRSLNLFHRMTETWWDDEMTWRDEHASLLEREAVGGSVVGTLFTHLSDEAPEYNLLRDSPPQHYPYATMPIEWSTGKRPEVPEVDGHDLWRYVYFFSYRDGVPHSDGEDWYLGHHTREGKQLPGLAHYVTWRRLGPPEKTSGASADARHFVRYTELCFEDFETWHQVCYSEGPRWHMSPEYGGVWGDYQQFFLGVAPDITVER